MEDSGFEAMARLTRAAAGDGSVKSLLRVLCEVTPLVLPGTTAGVMRIGSDGDDESLELVHAHPEAASTELVQHALGVGPCHEAMRAGETVAVADLETVQDRWPALVQEARSAGLCAVMAIPLRSRGRFSGVLSIYRRAVGEWSRPEQTAARVLADAAVAYIKMAQDRDEAVSAQAELSHRSLHDDLTGLPNRALLFDRMSQALTQARRRDTALGAVFLDLDRFKEVNDVYGHSCGDTVLTTVAQRLVAAVRAGDTVARLAGDEFVILCENLPSQRDQLYESITDLTDRLTMEIGRPIRHGTQELVVSASIGVALTTEEPTVTELLQIADAAMYVAKERGAGNVVVHDHQETAAYARGSHLARELSGAAERGELRLHYQPIYTARTARIQAVEALVRWEHPEAGLLTAHDFIGLADSDTLTRIGHWVTEEACRQLATWRRELGNLAPATMFCNVSPREMTDLKFHDGLAATLGRHGLQPSDLGLEILEEVFSYPLVLPALAHCQAEGHPLSVDDFGTGYSSLSRLVELPVRYAKMDRSFISGLPDDPRARALVNAVLVLARGLDLDVIGEGVETAAQRDYLAAAGCDFVQGFHLARPAPAGDVGVLLAAQRAG